MPYSQEIYHIAKERLSERRQQAQRMADFNREQLFQEIPRLSEINSELLSIGAAIAKAVVTNKPGENKKLRELSEKSLRLQDEQSKLLEDHHINKEVLEPHYYCTKCGDTKTQTLPKLINIANAEISGLEKAYYHTGSYIMPSVTVTLDKTTLTLNRDYEIVYKNCKNFISKLSFFFFKNLLKLL